MLIYILFQFCNTHSTNDNNLSQPVNRNRLGRVRVGSALLSWSGGHVHEAPRVLDSSRSTSWNNAVSVAHTRWMRSWTHPSSSSFSPASRPSGFERAPFRHEPKNRGPYLNDWNLEATFKIWFFWFLILNLEKNSALYDSKDCLCYKTIYNYHSDIKNLIHTSKESCIDSDRGSVSDIKAQKAWCISQNSASVRKNEILSPEVLLESNADRLLTGTSNNCKYLYKKKKLKTLERKWNLSQSQCRAIQPRATKL